MVEDPLAGKSATEIDAAMRQMVTRSAKQHKALGDANVALAVRLDELVQEDWQRYLCGPVMFQAFIGAIIGHLQQTLPAALVPTALTNYSDTFRQIATHIESGGDPLDLALTVGGAVAPSVKGEVLN